MVCVSYACLLVLVLYSEENTRTTLKMLPGIIYCRALMLELNRVLIE